MKKSILITLAFIAVVFITYILTSTAVINLTGAKYPEQDSIFIKTHWQQMGGFEKHTPDRSRLGCWSTALAQIVYHHKLKPFGRVAYTSTKGFRINETIDSTKIDLSKLSAEINSSTNEEEKDAMAKYNYYAALAIQKDFGTNNYMNLIAPAGIIEEHYMVDAKRYISWHHYFPNSYGKLKNVIVEEIVHKRPLFLHFGNVKNFGHSVVIDGYKKQAGRFLVHLNQGQGGPQDGWYDFDKNILHDGDGLLRIVYAIKPKVD